MLKFLFRVIAVPLLILFIIALPLSLALRSAGNLLFDPATTKELAREALADSELSRSLARRGVEQMLAGAVGESGSAQVASSVFALLDEEEWREITEVIAPEHLLVDTLDRVIDGFTDWLNTPGQDFPPLRIDLQRWKDNALQQASPIMTLVLDSLPDCTVSDATDLVLQAASDPTALLENLPTCRPPDLVYNQMIDQADRLVAAVITNTPDSIDLNVLTQGQQAPDELIELKQNLVLARNVLGWSWLAVLVVGIFAALLAADGLFSSASWFGWPLLLAGVLTVVAGFLLLVFNFQFLEPILASTQDSFALHALAMIVSNGALRLVAVPLLLQGLLVTLVAAAMLLYARMLRRRQESPGIPIRRRRIGL